jgi:phospholipid transport system substrate-binding protein
MKSTFSSLFALAMMLGGLLSFSGAARADVAPDAFIKALADEVMAQIKADKDLQSGDIKKISALVDAKIMPNVNFQRMTSLALGRYARTATPDQQKQVQEQFRMLLTRTYASAFAAAKDATIQLRPLRAAPDDTEVVVRSQVIPAQADPVQLDYRLEKSGASWKIYDINVLGIWLVETYRASFAQEIEKTGIDGLIKSLSDRNKRLEAAGNKKS